MTTTQGEALRRRRLLPAAAHRQRHDLEEEGQAQQEEEDPQPLQQLWGPPHPAAPAAGGHRRGAANGPQVQPAADAVGRTLVVGTFLPPARTSVARQDVLLILDRLGFSSGVEEVVNMRPTTKVVRVKMASWDSVTQAVQALLDHQATSRWAEQPLWGQRGRTPAEAARVGPIARAVRALKTASDNAMLKGRRVLWDVEGSYRPAELG